MNDDFQTPDDLDSTRPLGDDPGAPRTIGNYRLLQKLGEGGMGEVWEAEQEAPVRRRVALKRIKWGMDTKAVVARFEAERQALALMSHPNVAKVFDAGATERGQPYFVMELVHGVPITEYCDTHRLSTGERLRLFARVCAGVQHAHRQGIIHRDIKPSNVLVACDGDDAVPKIIDFGIAKATAQRLTEKTVFTAHGQMIGTPEYMSPEQADPNAEGIDTRTDVYSLGVLLYELLVGVRPFDSRELREAGYEELKRKIREDEPSKPSTRITTLGALATETAQRRRSDVGRLKRELRGDLDWITMRALEKDRRRRYDSPGELASDIERHLAHQPVLAGPPSPLYRARKFARRHRSAVGAVGFVLVVGVIFWIALLTFGESFEERFEAARVRLQSEDRGERVEAIQSLHRAGARREDYREAALTTLVGWVSAHASIQGTVDFDERARPLNCGQHRGERHQALDDVQAAISAIAGLYRLSDPPLDLRWASLEGVELSDAALPRTRFDRAALPHARLQRADLRHARMYSIDLRCATLANADLRCAVLRAPKDRDDHTQLLHTNLAGARLTGADFTHGSLQGAILHGARMDHTTKLTRTGLLDADLTGVTGLTQAQLDEACVNEATILPEGLTRPPICTAVDHEPYCEALARETDAQAGATSPPYGGGAAP